MNRALFGGREAKGDGRGPTACRRGEKEKLEEVWLRVSVLCGRAWKTHMEKEENREERVKKQCTKLLTDV